MQHDYTDPVAKLLDYGELEYRRSHEPWPDYLELGISPLHVPELIRMMTDADLNNADNDSLEVWAPVHAWRTLGQLRAVEAAKAIVRLFDMFPHDDWLATELPKVFSMIGPASIPAITNFMDDVAVDEFNRICAPACLVQIARDHPDHRDDCVGALKCQLALYEANGENLNAFLIGSLIDLQATETIDTVRAAFSANCVDLTVQGDVEDVEIYMGLRQTRDTPPPKIELIPGLPNLDADDDLGFGPRELPADPIENPFRHVGRNDPCPCGSGKKYKQCCLR